MHYRLRGHEDETNNNYCFSKSNQLIKKILRQYILRQLKLDLNLCLLPKHCKYGRLLVGYNMQSSSSSTNRNVALIIDHQLNFTNQHYPLDQQVSEVLIPLDSDFLPGIAIDLGRTYTIGSAIQSINHHPLVLFWTYPVDIENNTQEHRDTEFLLECSLPT